MRQNAQALEEILKNFDIWVQAPFEEAVQIPSALYTSGAVTEFEIEGIFRREWICIGQVDEIAAVGDYFVTDVAGQPLIILRDGADTMRALSNVCAHRGSLLAEGRGNARVLSCPYHAWTYELDGKLRDARADRMGNQRPDTPFGREREGDAALLYLSIPHSFGARCGGDPALAPTTRSGPGPLSTRRRATPRPRPALGCPRKRVNSSPSISTCFGLRPTPSSPAFSALVESTFPLTCSRRDRVSGSS